jgi:hypothetical protein
MADIQQAIDLIRQGHKKEAGPILEELIRSNPQDVTSWFWYAETLDSVQKRVQLMEACLKQNPGNAEVVKALDMLRAKQPPVQSTPSMSSNMESVPTSNVEIEGPKGEASASYREEALKEESNLSSGNEDEPDTSPESTTPNIHIEENEQVMAYLKEVNPFSEIISPYTPGKVNKNLTHSDFIGHFASMTSLPLDCKYVVYGCEALVHPQTGIIFGFVAGTSVILRLPKDILKELIDSGVSDLHRAKDIDGSAISQLESNWVSSGNFTEKLIHKCFGYYGMDPRVQEVLHLNFEEDYKEPQSSRSTHQGWTDRLFPLGIFLLVCLMIAFVIIVLNYLNIF